MFSNLSIGSVVKGSLWLYIGSVFFNLVGYLFWLVASLFVSPEVIGSAGAIISLYTSLATVLSFGVPMGVRRFMGASWSEKDRGGLRSQLLVALILLAIVNLPVIGFIFLLSMAGVQLLGLASIELGYVGLFLLLEFWPPLFYSVFNSVIRTRVIAFGDMALSSIKLLGSITFFLMGYGLIGILAGLAIGSLIRTGYFMIHTRKLLNENDGPEEEFWDFGKAKDMIAAGLAYWAPNTLTVLSQAIGVLAVYGFVGEGQTGLYYIALAIALIVYRFPDSIQALMFPLLSGMSDGRKRAASRAIKISVTLAAPLSLLLVLYPSLPFIFLGSAYEGASELLRILVIGAMIQPLISGYTSYIYAIGRYLHVTIIGFVLMGGRLLLYILLLEPIGTLGIAVGYTLGIGLAIAPVILSARYAQFRFQWSILGKALLWPVLLSLAVLIANLPWIIGIPSILLLSVIGYFRLHVLTRKDAAEIAFAFLGKETARRLYTRVRPLADWLLS